MISHPEDCVLPFEELRFTHVIKRTGTDNLDHMQKVLYYLHIAFIAIAVGKGIVLISYLREFSVRCTVGNRKQMGKLHFETCGINITPYTYIML
jgi:hypothetical protein